MSFYSFPPHPLAFADPSSLGKLTMVTSSLDFDPPALACLTGLVLQILREGDTFGTNIQI